MTRAALILLAAASAALADTSPRTPTRRIVVTLDGAKTIRFEFVRIPAGRFRMGPGRGSIDVRISRPFWLQTTEVTQRQWIELMGANPSETVGDEVPVGNVSWDDAQGFLEKFSRVARRKAELPTEAEWEYAARAGSASRWCFGDDEAQLAEYAWYGAGARGVEDGPQPVAQKKPNRWGLYDMHGNVLEWCADWYGPLPDSPQTDPRGPESGEGRVIRGGGWWGTADLSESGRRHSYGQDFRGRVNGFRVLLR